MCEYSCYKSIPEGAAWAQECETGEVGAIVAIRDGFVIVHVVDLWSRQFGAPLLDCVDADEVRHWCPLDCTFFDGSRGVYVPSVGVGHA